jgi:AcrR family transcriptional regulator
MRREVAVDGSSAATQVRDGRPLPKRFQEILDVAARLFAVQGYEATSIQGIAHELGLLKGSLYHYIQSKDDLLFWIILDVHEGLRQNLETYRDATGLDSETRLRRFVVGHALRNMEDRDRGAIFFRDFMYLGEQRRAIVLASRATFEGFVQDTIRRGQADGAFDPSLDPKIASFAILGMLNSLYVWYRPDGVMPAQQIAEQYGRQVLAGLRR